MVLILMGEDYVLMCLCVLQHMLQNVYYICVLIENERPLLILITSHVIEKPSQGLA